MDPRGVKVEEQREGMDMERTGAHGIQRELSGGLISLPPYSSLNPFRNSSNLLLLRFD
jgi:hypothetical protein